jgi:rubrerythrin
MSEEKNGPLLKALKSEKESYNFYARMEKRNTNPTGQSMLKKLMKEEKKHIKLIENRLKELKASTNTDKITEYNSLLSEVDFADPALSDLEIIETAIEDERYAFAVYTKASREVSDEDERKMYQQLADDEMSHIQLLEKESKRLRNA